MTEPREDQRGELEDTLGRLGVAMIILDDQVQLRLAQAIRRDHSLADLLEPAIAELDDINGALQSAQNLLGQVWQEKEYTGWGRSGVHQK